MVHLHSEEPFRELSRIFQCATLVYPSPVRRYLQNGNMLGARTFITHFTSALPRASDTVLQVGDAEVVLVKDPVVNFAQLAVLTCQRAQGDRNKAVRESWVRLCGTYQSRGGIMATVEVRQVRSIPLTPSGLSETLRCRH